MLWAAPAFALHRSSPGAIRLTSGAPHSVSSGRSWGFNAVFASDADLLQNGATGKQIYLFKLFDYDCQRGILRPDILQPGEPCPDPPNPYLVQVTDGPGNPDNPTMNDPGFGNPGQVVAFDAQGIFTGATGPASLHRQIFYLDPATREMKQMTNSADGDSTHPSLNRGGGALVYESTASILGGPAGVSQIYVKFLKSLNGTPQDNLTLQLTHGLGPSTNATFNLNGSMVTFESTADLLGDGHDTGISQIFVAQLDRQNNTSTLLQLTNGNAPSHHPWIAERDAPGAYFQSGVWFDSTATNLPGTIGEPGTHVFQAPVIRGSLPPIAQKTFTNPLGDCSFPTLDQFATTVGYICTGDPLANGTTGNRVFVTQQKDDGSLTLFQLTGRGDVKGPISGSVGHNFILMADTTDLTNTGSCDYQLELVDFFDDNLDDNLFLHWAAATHPGQLPQDVAPPVTTGGGPPGTNVLGSHIFHIEPGTPTSGSQITLITQLGTFVTPIVGNGNTLLNFAPRDSHGSSVVDIPTGGISFPPLPIPGVGTVCVRGDVSAGDGLLDCDGGSPGASLSIWRDHNTNDVCAFGCREDAPCHGPLPAPHPGVCNGPLKVQNSALFRPGDMGLRIPLRISLSTNDGFVGGPCTDDDTYVIGGPAGDTAHPGIPVSLFLTTEHVDGAILNADDTTGVTLAGSANGAVLDCEKVKTGDFGGATLVGTIPFLDLPTPFAAPFDHLDAIVNLRLVGANQDCIDCICIPAPCNTDADCNNNNVCDGADVCSNHTCLPGTPLNCDDGNACTADTCDPILGCQHVAITGACDDGNACTTGDTCQTGSCVGTPITCTDNDPCTLDTCDPALGCVFPDRCTDNNVCNGVEACDAITQACIQVAAALNCDDGNPCTDDTCDPIAGCQHTNNTAPCDDLSLCTFNDTCSGGACVGVPVQCDNGNACDGLETCDSATGACLPGGLPNCDDGNPCTDDTCDPAVGCLHLNNTLPCDDGSVCTNNDTCSNGVCKGTLVIICSDGNPCNGDETCDPITGACGPGINIPTCDDGNVCTDDSCTPFVGCAHTPNTAPCDDGKRCTFNDTCSGGTCGGTPVACENGNVCDGVATCDSATGACIPGAIPNCDDGNPCTDDTCDPVTGCMHQNNTGACDDGNQCTLFDTCDGNGACVGQTVNCSDGNQCNGTEVCDPATGACVAGTPPNCDDGDVCTFDTCVAATGCQNTPVPNYLSCRASLLKQVLDGIYAGLQGAPIGTFALDRHRQAFMNTTSVLDRKVENIVNGASTNQSRRVLKGVKKKATAMYNRVYALERSGAIQAAFADALRAQLNTVILMADGLLGAMAH